jgi:hypothetical protein
LNFGLWHGTAGAAGQVVLEHSWLLLGSFFAAFAGAIDNIAKATPTTMIDEVFMAFLPNSKTSPERGRSGPHHALAITRIFRVGGNALGRSEFSPQPIECEFLFRIARCYPMWFICELP